MRVPFLSREWLELAQAVRLEMEPSVCNLGVEIGINVTITGLDANEEPPLMFIDLREHGATFDVGHLPTADVGVTVGYDLAREMVTTCDAEAALHEIMAGRIQVSGDYPTLLQLGGMLATDGAGLAAEIAQRVSAFTL